MAVSPTTMAAVRASGAVPNAEYLLSAEGVRKEFPGVVALDDVQFRLKRASVHALMGENGAGKSTLMKILAGIYTPDKGDIRLKGIEIQLKSPLDALENGIAMIHQELNLMPFMTVAENIWIRREPKNRLGFIDHGVMHRMTEELFTRLNIAIDPDIEVRFLSVANRQMVEIAKAVSYNSDVLIMDEPTSALTEREVEHLFRIIRDLRAQGIGIVYITHKMNELFEIADEFSVFRDGRYIGTHASTDVTRDDIIRMMVGREITQMFPKEEVPIGEVVLSVKDLCLNGVFKNVSFEVRAGEILGVAGLVGSGRSNVAETLFGVTPASSGSIELYGKPVTISSPTEAIRNRMAFLTEDRKDTGCLLILDILENMQIAVLQDRYVKGGFVQQGAVEATCEDMAKKLRVKTPNLYERVENLSGGNQQKVLIGRWLLTNPRILILDEPTRGIDVGAKAEIHRLVVEMARNGVAVVMISSEMPEVLGMSDRIMVMHEGRVTGFLNRDEATQIKVMELAAQ
ncbi:sugar ABC transporter ATP-binding protein [Rhizobium leguminosarum]|jgi:inositol transport system ATP-binding protein|uniref:Ribose/galactose/methyl galactoside import ATP-binding protein n=1 Tax=Rhizobium leguminosarum bv. trifolii TaxID=386 RepID=A0A1B8R3Z3_RHILT|nr:MULTISPECIES: sugar ABC transporter ATP-binding protein [Rhizobium]AOO93564.1 D-ribose transporter ATP-binding protein [Rhizobium leguminosarum bv. trifolii]MBA8833144.1 inositol transport system ATP-binding protein [Rhizobium leguminosarum]MBA9032452.1 inositol transport system ATP-binding protein [Rhizobium leguminosarum]MBP2485072.1 inositol transport system ATP-binding protein [Rhizobium leguminosarum]MBY5464630.1 sugar ABC transporter ATP-binding protein [Rhizobium leguminosarum]